MIELLEQEIKRHGHKSKIISIDCLEKLRQDVEEIKRGGVNNDFAKEIIDYYYDFSLPALDFEIRSIIIVASKSPAAKVTFDYKNKKVPLMIPPSYVDMSTKYIDVEKYLIEFLDSKGYHAKCTPCIPQKLLAVRSGLCSYGRNNITYTDGFGSFLRIVTLYSDVPSSETEWHSLKQMDSCKGCKACINNCPTGAITEEDFLIRTDRCLTHYNERDGFDFPEWIDPSAHNCIVGCFKCQKCCPHNQPFLGNVIEPVEFSAEETTALLDGVPLDNLSEKLREKLKTLDMLEYFNCIPRNLKALFNQVS